MAEFKLEKNTNLALYALRSQDTKDQSTWKNNALIKIFIFQLNFVYLI